MRSGPLVRRGAQISRVLQNAPAQSRRRTVAKPPIERTVIPLNLAVPIKDQIIEASCLHAQCKLPINLREFLATQFGETLNSNNDAILEMAANADDATLSRVARAIRRYSTNRAREAWSECAAPLVNFEREGAAARPATALCLTCARIDFGAAAEDRHRSANCLTIDFSPACIVPGSSDDAISIPDRLQRKIEEFRSMRSAFGLPHYELDCYVASRRVTFSWRPVDLGAAEQNF